MFGSLKAAYDVAKDVQALQISTEVKTAIADILDKLVDARSDAIAFQERETALLQEVGDLKKEVDRLKAWGDEKEDYDLKALGMGAFAYMLKPDKRGTTIAHWLCTRCYTDGKKSIMQAQGSPKGEPGNAIHACPSCKASFLVRHWTRPEYDPDGND